MLVADHLREKDSAAEIFRDLNKASSSSYVLTPPLKIPDLTDQVKQGQLDMRCSSKIARIARSGQIRRNDIDHTRMQTTRRLRVCLETPAPTARSALNDTNPDMC